MTPLESRHSRRYLGTTLLALALAATGCTDTEEPTPSGTRYEATVRRTAFGVPHITADTLGAVGYGQGYAFAQDNACTLLDQIIKVRGERARYLGAGPDGVH